MKDEQRGEGASERGAWATRTLSALGRDLGLEVAREYPVVGGRIDVVWLWHGSSALPVSLPLVGFEIESSWRTRKHIKGDLLNLIDLQPALGVIILLGKGPDVESTVRFARTSVDLHAPRIQVWTEEDIEDLENGRLPSEIGGTEGGSAGEATAPTERTEGGTRHTGKYRLLWAWLVSSREPRIATTFSEIEEVLGFPLPPSCRRHIPHWHSYEGSAVARAILDAGWRAKDVDLTAERLVLERINARS